MKLSDFAPHVQRKIIADNPGLLGVGELPAADAERQPARALEQAQETPQRRQRGVARGGVRPRERVIRIALIRFGPRELDSVNLAYSFKEIQDAIAHWFGLDDFDRGIEWRYGQIPWLGKPGVLVRVEAVEYEKLRNLRGESGERKSAHDNV